jgi:hypothetical protein
MKTYKAQEWDEDCECWEDMDDVAPSNDKYWVQDEAKQKARQCSYHVKTRVIEAK